MIPRSVMRWSGAVALSLLTLACTPSGDRSAERRATTRTKVRVSMSPHLSWAPIFIAQAEGEFAREGLDVELVPAMRTEETLVALVTGDIDVRPGPVSAGVLSAIGKGAPIRIVGGMGVLDPAGCTYYGIVARKGLDTSGTPTLRRIRASQDGSTRFVVHHMLAQRGLALNTLETVRLPDAVMIGSMQTGAVDAVAASEPALTRIAAAGTPWLAGERALPGHQWAVIAFSERMWKRDPALGTRFMRAYRRGIARYREGKSERNVRILAEATGEDPAVVRSACWLSIPAHGRIAWPTIQAFQQWAVTEGLMENVVSESQAWDSTFVAASDR